MKAIKHFSILILALCCSYFANAQCPNQFTDTVRGNTIAVNVVGNATNSYTYAWFLDGSLVMQANPNTSYLYQNVYAGTHNLCLFVYSNGALCDSVCQTATVTSCGTLTAQWTDVIGTRDTVRFVAYDTNTIAHHYWSFGDNNSGSGNTVIHVYNAPGTYHVCFYSYIPGSVCTDSLCQNVVVPGSNGCGVASFLSYIIGDSAIRTYSNSTGVDSTNIYSWLVYNSSGSLLQSQSGHTSNFLSHGLPAGVYRVCLYLYNANQLLCDSACNSVTILNCTSLTAAWQSTTSTSNDSVTLFAATNPTGTTYSWTFGDGSSYSTTSSTWFHNYANPGTYNVCLITSNTAILCRDTVCRSIVVGNVIPGCGVASFACYILNDSTIRGYSTSTGTDTNSVYNWYVYNSSGTLVQSQSGRTANFLSHGMHPGVYRVCLYLYNGNQVLCDSACNSVTVLSCSSLNAQWTHSAHGDSITYSAPTNNPAGSTYSWTFGDGTTSYYPGVTHVYSRTGTYTVCLVVSNPALTCHDTLCQSITVGTTSGCGTASFSSYVVGDTSIHAYSTSTGVDTNSIYNWTIRNAAGTIVASHDGRNVTYISSQGLPVGTYSVCEYLYNSNQQFCDSFCSNVVLSNCSGLTASWTYTTSHDTVFFVAVDTNTHASHYWSFGDGNVGSGTHVSHVYVNPGTYRVCFHDYISGTICNDSLCESVAVTSSGCGIASFTSYVLNDTSIHAFSNSTGTNASTIYKWTVKGANGSILQTQTGSNNYFLSHHLYPGAYTVCLTLYYGSVLCDSFCNTVVVPIIGACGTAAFSDTVIAAQGGQIIHAYATSTNVDSISQYSWKIWGPNGNLVQTFTGVNEISSAILLAGNYVVCQYIRATDLTNICDSICHTVAVGNTNPCGGLSAAWTYTLQSNTTDSVEFHGAVNPTGTYYYWTFGDGTSSYYQNVLHGYAHAGTYTVCLVISLPGSVCRDTSCQTVVITTTTPCPVASFNQYVYQDSMIHAYSNSTGTTTGTVYEWVVTNSTGLAVQSATSTGTTASFMSHGLPNGVYNVCLFIYANTNTFCDSTCHTITIADTINPCSGLNAAFTTTHLNNGNVQFIPADTAAGVTHYWHFGDGTVSTNNDPIHAYSRSGLYHVCQYVYYAGSNCLDSFCTNVQASASGCSANFSYQGYYPPYNGVHFTNLSTSSDSIISYYWSFGDSTTGHFANGNHVYPHSGRWLVCLNIYTAHGCSSTYCDSINVSYDPCYGLSANYTYTYTQGGGVHFAGSTSLNSVTNLWTFGDGTSATTFDPTHYYTQAGTFTVCHIVTIPGTLCSDTSCQSVQGTGVGTGCHANFTDSITPNTPTVIFYNHSTSTDSITSYVWSFGDGSGSTSANTHHTYTASGSVFNVCLTITTANGCSNTYCDSIHVGRVTPTCHASFTYTVDSCQVITFTSTSTGSLGFLRWIYGDGTTDTLSHPTHVYGQGGYYTVVLHFYGNNGCYNFDTAVILVPSCGIVGDTVCGVVFNDLNGNGVQNTGETGVANAEVHVGSYVTHTDSTGHYVIVVPAGTYSIYYCAPTGYTFTIPVHTPLNANNNCSAYQTVHVTGGSNCGYNFGIQHNTVTICGTVYFDANDNHVQDQNESGIANTQVVFTDSGHVVYTAYTDQYGHYCAVLPTGNYVITPGTGNYHNGVVTPTSITVNATTSGGSYDNNNFGVYVAPGACDLSINVTPNTTVTPGYPAWYQIEVCNVGANVTSGSVNLFYDPSLRYNYSSPAATSQNSTTFTANWALNHLNPGSCQYYYVSFTADSNLVTGQFIFTLASVTTDSCTDANQTNNVDTVHQNVTASWDPNNKEVSPAGTGPEGLVHGNQWLTYTINFQNTGTAPAVNIVIQDTLSQFLDITTFKMLGSSLPYTMQFAGNEAIWKFNAVMLPDSSTDQQASHGFVTFMILPLPNLPSKTQITNRADIFFDYNAGVSTNRTLNTIDYTLSVDQVAPDNVTITLQPNPFSQYTTIKVDGAEGPYELHVYDMLGRVVKSQTAGSNIFNIERGNMASGMYMYEVLHNGTLVGKGKMIAQ